MKVACFLTFLSIRVKIRKPVLSLVKVPDGACPVPKAPKGYNHSVPWSSYLWLPLLKSLQQ